MTTQAFRPLKTKAPAQPAPSTSTSLAPNATSTTSAAAQKQTTSQSQITFSQSLSVVKTLLSVSFGCIAYLRGLLPEENFTDNSTTHTLSADLRGSSQDKKTDKGALKVKTIKRNYSPEGDKLMDYLEKGVMDAIEKQYLRALVMSIYMNPDDPANVIETYTFNFSYPTLEDGTKIPVLNVTSNGKAMPLATDGQGGGLLDAAREGGVTVGAVKKAVRGMIKQLILLTQNLADLPRKRCLSFKTFYEDHTPDDYHPPMFREANAETERLYFGTRSRNQAPDVSTVSKVDTGYHGIQLTIRSVTDLLPPSADGGDGLQYGQVPPGKTAAEIEEITRKDDAALQKDEEARKYLWSAEEEVWKAREDEMDAEGSPDPDVSPSQVPSSPPVFGTAFAVRKTWDTFEPIDKAARRAALKGKAREDARKASQAAQMTVVEPVELSSGERDLQSILAPQGATTGETQPIDSPQADPHSVRGAGRRSPLSGPSRLSVPYSISVSRRELEDDPIASFSTRAADDPGSQRGTMEVDRPDDANRTSDADSLAGVGHLSDDQPSFPQAQLPRGWSSRGPSGEVDFMLDPDFRQSRDERRAAAPASSAKKPNETKNYFPERPPRRSERAMSRAAGGSSGRQAQREETAQESAAVQDWLPCWCGDHDEDLDSVSCDGPGCKRFTHCWCAGFKAAEEYADGEPFFCPSCRLRSDPRTAGWLEARFEECLRSFQELALFRRAIRVVFDEAVPATLSLLAKRLDCSSPDAKGVLERLLREGFIKQVAGKPTKTGRASHKKKIFVVDRSKDSDADLYFSRNTSLEDRLFGLPLPQASSDSIGSSAGALARPGDLSQGSSILSALPDEPAAVAAGAKDDEESQTQVATYPYPPPSRAVVAASIAPSRAPSNDSIPLSPVRSRGLSSVVETQMLPPPPRPFATPAKPAVPSAAAGPHLSLGVQQPHRKTLARAFDAAEEGSDAGKRARTSRVGVARSGLDLTT